MILTARSGRRNAYLAFGGSLASGPLDSNSTRRTLLHESPGRRRLLSLATPRRGRSLAAFRRNVSVTKMVLGSGRLDDAKAYDGPGLSLRNRLDWRNNSNKSTEEEALPSEKQVSRSLYKDQNDTWADHSLPSSVLPYAKLMRVDRPIGTWLLLLPSCWSIALAAPPGSVPDLQLMGLFGVGAFVMRGAGCTINDFWDRDIDGKVARTKERPIASGAVSPAQALAFAAAQCLVGLGVLVQLNTYTVVLGAASLIPVAIYPLAKRVTNWPQAVLGLTINWGALVGYSAVTGSIDPEIVLPLYFGSAMWTLVYDTIYAYQDRSDDSALGLKSSALTIGEENFRPVLGAFAVTAVGLWEVAGLNAGLGASPWFQAAMVGSAAHLAWQISSANLSDRVNLTKRFVSNQNVGFMVLSGISLAKYFG